MRPYFEKMPEFGKPLCDNVKNKMEESVAQIKEVEKGLADAVEKVKSAGLPAEKLNKRGEMTVHQRLEYLLDSDTWCPLHTLYDPMEEASGTTGVVDGLGRINGKWAVVIGFDNKVMAGAWIAGQADNLVVKANDHGPLAVDPGETVNDPCCALLVKLGIEEGVEWAPGSGINEIIYSFPDR